MILNQGVNSQQYHSYVKQNGDDFNSVLNYVMQQIGQPSQELGNATIDVTNEIVGERTIKDYPSDKGGRYKTPIYEEFLIV